MAGSSEIANRSTAGLNRPAMGCRIADAARNAAARLFSPVSIGVLVYFRIAFGAIMCWEIWRYISKGWIARYYIDPVFHFSYFPIELPGPLPGTGMYRFFLCMGLLAIMFTVGLFYRVSSVLLFVGFSYWFMLDETNYLNHFYLVWLICLVMMFLPANRRWSLDAVLRPGMQSDSMPAWCLWLLRFLIALPYFFGGVAKLNADWLSGRPMNLWLPNKTDVPLIGQWFDESWMHLLFSYGGLGFDLLIVPALLWRRTRTPALVIAIAFHLTNAMLFEIGIFPWLMIAATLLLFPPAWLSRTRWWLSGGHCDNGKSFELVKLSRCQLAVVAVLGLFVAVQLLLPLRHWAYPGNVHWDEAGHRFSWHMKLRSKSGRIRLFVFDLDRREAKEVDLSQHLTSRQRKKMATHPDMILQFAHHLSQVHRSQGRPNVAVHAEAWVRLNGRPWQLMVDPRIDLASQPRTWEQFDWVLPLNEGLIDSQSASSQADHRPHR